LLMLFVPTLLSFSSFEKKSYYCERSLLAPFWDPKAPNESFAMKGFSGGFE
jgi:hypothetical protein